MSNDKQDAIRSQAAYALGVITLSEDADPQLMIELEKLVEDLHSDARYNAALALARQGSLLAVPALVEMLDLRLLAVTTKDPIPQAQTRKRNTILKNALDAVVVIQMKNPGANLSDLQSALQKFIKEAPEMKPAPVPPQLIERAEKVLEHL